MSEITLLLPFPPSLNSIWRVGHGHNYNSGPYVRFKREALHMLEQQELPDTITGPVKVEYAIDIKKRRPRSIKGKMQSPDLFNYEKATSDILTDANVWVDDSQIMEGRMYWSDEVDNGIMVTITTLENRDD